ncbi:hypothetical protein ACVWYQ_006348 [Bradyrhizobium sp. USDA 3397]
MTVWIYDQGEDLKVFDSEEAASATKMPTRSRVPMMRTR